MSKELTEQWKNGTLKEGWYFLEFENGSILPVYYCGFNREFEFGFDWKISKVLAPASYDHFVELTEKANQLEKENTELVTKCHRLEKQLDIAVKALRDYADEENWSTATTEINTDYFTFEYSMYGLEHNGFIDAQQALKEIDEVLK